MGIELIDTERAEEERKEHGGALLVVALLGGSRIRERVGGLGAAAFVDGREF